MFTRNLSDTDRARLDKAYETGHQALTVINDHVEECKGLRRETNNQLKGIAAEQRRLLWWIIGVLIMVLMKFLGEIAPHVKLG